MTRIRFAVAATLAIQVVLAGLALPAQALSVGAYVSAGGGVASWDDRWDWDDGDDDWDLETRHTAAGFALETPTGVIPLGYRLGIGWERIVIEGEIGRPEHTLKGLVIDQDLTFDLFASPRTRLWIGPELRLAFLRSDLDDSLGGDRDFVAAGVGPVFGFDVALNPGVALSWKFGYLVTGYDTDDDSWGDDRSRNYHDDDSIAEGHGYVSLSVLFGLWGGPQPGPPPPQYQPRGRW